jgi:hypothetical protein
MTPMLPANLEDWPEDGFRLLGVERGAEDVEIRRAYTRLIRHYKPEHHPEEFRRIREAYESCQQQASWFRHDAEIPAETPREPLPTWTQSTAERPASRADELWAKAIDGDLAGAYEALAFHITSETETISFLRLYWLLMFDKKIDTIHTRHHWLFQALKTSNFNDTSVELYRRELLVDPVAALNEPYAELLQVETSNENLLRVTRLRLMAAGKIGSTSTMMYDLSQVQSRLLLDAEQEWFGLLLTAFDWAIWDRPSEFLDWILSEFQKLKHLELENSYGFDHIESTLQMTRALERISDVSQSPILQLIRLFWVHRYSVENHELQAVLQPVGQSPALSLDQFMRYEAGLLDPSLFEMVARYLSMRYLHRVESIPAEQLRGFARRITNDPRQFLHRLDRLELLAKLIPASIAPIELAEALLADPESSYRKLGEWIERDKSLQIVGLAAIMCPQNPKS